MTEHESLIESRAAIWIHGYPAKSWEQVVKYLDGDPHERSKVAVLVDGRFYDLILGEDGE